MNTGIYAIYHEYNPNKFYIGSTSVNFNTRFKVHLNKLRKNIHRNAHLQNIANKYGVDGFKLKIIEEVKKKNCLEREQYWIDKLDVFNNGYNQSAKAKNCVVDKEVRLKINEHFRKPILQLDINGKILNKFESITTAARVFKVRPSSIGNACRDLTRIKKYYWVLEDKYSENLKLSNPRYCGKINQYNLDNTFIKTWKNLKEASEAYTKSSGKGAINGACRGIYKTAYGYKWSYAEIDTI